MPTPKKTPAIEKTHAKSEGRKTPMIERKSKEIKVVLNEVELESDQWGMPSTFKEIEMPKNFDSSNGFRVEMKLPKIDFDDELHKELKIIDVANIAVRFLKGDNFDDAVDRAMFLLRTAAKSVTTQRKVRLAMYCNPTSLVPRSFKEGAKFITGQKRTDRATEYLQDFWEANAISKKELNERISKHEKAGFTIDEMESEKLAYQQWRKKTP